MHGLSEQFLNSLRQTSLTEFVAVISGIASVWLSKKENILVYPVGLVSTIIYVYVSIKGELYGEASVNFYYTFVSVYGWIIWARKNDQHQHLLHITKSSKKEWELHLLFFAGFYIVIFSSLIYLKKAFDAHTVPWADAFASATAYTGMWLMAKKKVESWYWWIATNIVSIPLYYIKGYSFTSVYYSIILVLAFFGLMEWKERSEKVQERLNL